MSFVAVQLRLRCERGCREGVTHYCYRAVRLQIVVANAGDSRAVLCRGGTAIDLSIDHKPEDDVEKTRIVNAGGFVNEDGR